MIAPIKSHEITQYLQITTYENLNSTHTITTKYVRFNTRTKIPIQISIMTNFMK